MQRNENSLIEKYPSEGYVAFILDDGFYFKVDYNKLLDDTKYIDSDFLTNVFIRKEDDIHRPVNNIFHLSGINFHNVDKNKTLLLLKCCVHHLNETESTILKKKLKDVYNNLYYFVGKSYNSRDTFEYNEKELLDLIVELRSNDDDIKVLENAEDVEEETYLCNLKFWHHEYIQSCMNDDGFKMDYDIEMMIDNWLEISNKLEYWSEVYRSYDNLMCKYPPTFN